MDVLAAFIGEKKKVTWSLPHSEEEHQLSVNDCWLCIFGYLSGYWLQISICKVLAAFSIKTNSGMLPAPS